MPLNEWYLNITELPAFDAAINDYIDGLRPHRSEHWNLQSNIMKAYKSSLLDQLLKIQKNRCVYCGLDLDRHLIDREHFAHKDQDSGWPEFMFTIENLFAACAFCNRAIKGTKKIILQHNPDYSLCKFAIIHPLFDTPSDHLEFIPNNIGEAVLARSITELGHSTMLFFDLASATMTSKRAAYILELQRKQQLSATSYEELKSISHFKPV